MKLCTFTRSPADRGDFRVGVLFDEKLVIDVSNIGCLSGRQRLQGEFRMRAFLEKSDTALAEARKESAEAIRQLESGKRPEVAHKISDIRLEAPIPRPGKIVATLVNTRGMLGGDAIELKHPRLFMKASSTVVAPGEPILAPWYGVRPEVELAAVIRKRLSRAAVEEAEHGIFGYTVLNDVTAPLESKEDAYEAYRRDPATGSVRRMTLRGPLFRSKNHDTFCPMGPCIVTSDQLPNVGTLRMTAKFNGEFIQDGSTSEYIFRPAEVVAYVSRFLTLDPGDIVSAGTIGWVAAKLGNVDPSEWVLPSLNGVLELEIEGIGVLRNPVKSEE